MQEKASRKGIQARHDERRQKRIREQKIRRYTFFGVLAVIAILIVMFFTPFFNIKNVEITGNNKITYEQIISEIGELEGKNLFRTGKGSIKKKLSKLTYAEKITVKKKLTPPTLSIEITERKPAMQFLHAENYMIADAEGRILEKVAEKQEGIPVCEGLKVVAATEGEIISLKDQEVQKIIFGCIQTMQKEDIIKDITVMSFEDVTKITFNYQSRIDVLCGGHMDMQQKLRMLKEAVSQREPTARGTIDLSERGQAIYAP